VQSVNFIKIWLVTTELAEILFQSSELQFFIAKMILEDLLPTSLETANLNSLSLEVFQELATKDSELYSKLTDQTPSSNDGISQLFKLLIIFIDLV